MYDFLQIHLQSVKRDHHPRKRPESYEKCTTPSDWRTDLHP